MKRLIITSTDLKTDTADILNTVIYAKTDVAITRHGKVVARIVPEQNSEEESAAPEKLCGKLLARCQTSLMSEKIDTLEETEVGNNGLSSG